MFEDRTDIGFELGLGRLQRHEADSKTKANIAGSSQTATTVAPQAKCQESVIGCGSPQFEFHDTGSISDRTRVLFYARTVF